MGNIRERLEEFIEHIGSNPSDFSVKIGKSRGYIRSIKEDIGSGVMNRIIRTFPSLDIYWLITGEGEMLRKNEQDVLETSPIHKELLDRLEKKSEEIGRLNAEINKLKAQLNIKE